MLEWCEDTMPIGSYLIGAEGAHKRYRPDDYEAGKCRKLMQTAAENQAEKQAKFKVGACVLFIKLYD